MIATSRLPMSVNEPTLYVAFELGKKEWKLAMTSGFGTAPWLRTVASGDWRAVERAIAQGRARFDVPAEAPVVSCYEAGRDGFWIHRALVQQGIRNRVVDSSSIEVNRRARRAKADRIDALKLVQMLVRACYGERGVERSARADGDRGGGAPGESRADRVDAGADATDQSNAGLAGDVGQRAAAAATARLVDDGPRLGGRDAAGHRASAPRARGGAARAARRADRGARRAAADRGELRGAGDGVASVGAAEGRRDDERVGLAR